MEDKYPIRILIVDGKLICGGVEAFLMNIYRHIDRSKIQFDFLVHYKERFFYDDEVEKLGGRIYRLSFRNDNNYFKYISDLKNFFKEHREYKIVWGHMDGLASIYLRIAKKNNVNTTICHSHITNAERTFKGVVKKILRKGICKYTDYCFACSTEAGRYLYKKNNFQIIPNAIDTPKFSYNIQTRNDIRNINGWNNKVVIGHVGRFNEQKNHKYLINIFFELTKVLPSSILCLCGDGENRKYIEKYVKSLGIANKVFFTGNIPNVNEYFQAFDFFVMPSLYEGLPVSGIEAQTSGLKCLFSDTITLETSVIKKNVVFLPITHPAKTWSKVILDNIGYVRTDCTDIIKDNNYDINDLCLKLTNFFISL